jgi:tRNA pseudouridine55 synthase
MDQPQSQPVITQQQTEGRAPAGERRKRLPPFNHNGVVLVDKPAEWTSHDVVNFIRARFNIQKAGHCGTLDPAATGLLVLVIGRFTKLSAKFSGEDKIYKAVMLMGTETDTQDMDGRVTSEKDFSHVTKDQFQTVLKSFLGEQEQIPPMVSAVKKDGAPLYELARKGIEIEREPKQIFIKTLDLERFEPPYAHFTVECSKGTYVRTLCADIGAKLGCGGALSRLIRTKSGSFTLENAVSIETLRAWTQRDLYDYMMELLHRKITALPDFAPF